MQEDKKRTTPPGENGGTRRRRSRKKTAARSSQKGEKTVSTAAVPSPEPADKPVPTTDAPAASADTTAAVPSQEPATAAAESELNRKESPAVQQNEAAQAEIAPAAEKAPAEEEKPAATPEASAESANPSAAEAAPEESMPSAEQTADADDAVLSDKPVAGEGDPEETAAENKPTDEETSGEESEEGEAQTTPEVPAAGQPDVSGGETELQDLKPQNPERAVEESPEKAEEELASPEEALAAPEKPASEESQAKTPAEEAESAEDEAERSAQEEPAEQQDSQDEESDADEAEDEEELLPEEDEKRLSDLTRTVQLSVEQIMAQVSDETAEPENTENTAEEDSDEMDEEPVGLADQMRSGLSGMAKWLLLVLFFVLVIACCGVAWLYRNATPDVLPQITASFDGQTLEPTAYKWKVPVIGNGFKRTYADTFSSTAVALSQTVDQVSPDFEISPSGYRSEVTVTDASDTVIFEGNTDSFSDFQFTANGTYTAKLVVHSDASSVPGDATVTGSETWLFSFTVGVRPSMHLSSSSVSQGSVVAISVGDTLDGSAPTLETELANVGFYKANSGWVCYLPIPWNEPAGTKTVVVTAGGYTETLEFTVEAASWEYKDYYSQSQRVSPYIGAGDLPAEVKKLLTESEATIAWNGGNFVQPFLNTLNVKLAYGTTEYVGRSYSERSSNTGAGGRTATNAVLTTKSGELLIAPANGTVLLAKDLGGDYGYTLVIDHGAGVKSIFYNLQKINVKAGATLKQGQTIATCGSTTVAEMRIGTVPIDPLQVWRGQCDALKYY